MTEPRPSEKPTGLPEQMPSQDLRPPVINYTQVFLDPAGELFFGEPGFRRDAAAAENGMGC